MKKFLTLIVLAFAIISCNTGEEPKYVVNTGFSCFNSVKDNSEMANALTAGSYDMIIDFTNLKFDMRISVSLRNDLSPVVLSMKDIAMSFDDKGGYKFKVAGEIPATGAEGHKISDLEGKIFAYYKDVQGHLQENYLFAITYKVDDRYEVDAISRSATFYGSTMTQPVDGKGFSSDARVTIKLTDSKTATMTIRNAKFAEGMPPMTMVVPNLPVVASDGGYSIVTERAVPQIGDKPYEQFAFSDVNIKVLDHGTELSANYKCNFKGIMHSIATSASIFPQPKPQN